MSRPCPLCAESESTTWLTKASLRLVRCVRCGMIFANPLPEESGEAYYERLGEPYYLAPDKLASDYSPVRFERELALVRRFCEGGDLLDVGCSTGAFLHELQRRHGTAYRSTGVEISRPALEHARRQGLEVIEDSLLEHDFEGRRFDLITFWAVLEHLPDPDAFVRRAADLLRPGGHCVALVPNLESMAVRMLGKRYRYILPQHLNYFSATTLRRLLSNAHLSPIAAGGSHFNPVVLLQDWRRNGDDFVKDGERAALLGRTTRLKESTWLAPLRWMLMRIENLLAAAGFADNIWVVARKS